MKKIEKLLKGHKYLCFLDFEGTQFSHEMIAIGAVICSLDKDNTIKKEKEPFKILVKAKNKIGKYVSELTGIKEVDLEKNGVSFLTALETLKKYCGLKFKKCSFVTFGNHDMTILRNSISYNFNFPKEICSQIQKNYIDFATFINEFIRDNNGNPLSLVHACELFNVPTAGEAHDPRVDAINLAHLYNAFVSSPELVKEQYKKTLPMTVHLPSPISQIIRDLSEGKNVTPEDYDKYLTDYIK